MSRLCREISILEGGEDQLHLDFSKIFSNAKCCLSNIQCQKRQSECCVQHVEKFRFHQLHLNLNKIREYELCGVEEIEFLKSQWPAVAERQT